MSGSRVPGQPVGTYEAPARSPGRYPWCRAYRMFAATAASVPGVRWWVRECLTRAGADPDARGRAELLISELATNAIKHAHGVQVMVTVQTGAHIEAAVRDNDTTLPILRHAEPWETGGRGLALVAALADDWGVEPTGAGKWVWFRVDPHPL